MLHGAKKAAILQWFNALTANVNVIELSQFTDGTLFWDLVTSIYSQAQVENLVPKFTLSDCSINEDTSRESAATATKENSEVTIYGPKKKTDEANQNDVSKRKGLQKDGSKTIEAQKYEEIEKFIDTFFQLKSSDLVSYPECIEGKELELAKVAVLLLSAVVQNFLSSNDEALATIMLLEHQVQEDIRECLSLFLEENPTPTKADVHKVLAKGHKTRKTPRKSSTNASPEIVKKRGRVASVVYEEIQESPLKSFLQSPTAARRNATALFRKETEIAQWRGAFHTEEAKVCDLILEKRAISEKLDHKREELEQLKFDFRKFQADAEEREGIATIEKNNLMAEIERLNNNTVISKETIINLEKEKQELWNRFLELERLQNSSVSQDKIDPALIAQYQLKIEQSEQEKFNVKKELDKCKGIIDTLEADVRNFKDLYEEAVKKNNIVRSESSSSLRVPEIASDLINEDKRKKDLADMREYTNNLATKLEASQKLESEMLDKVVNEMEKHKNLLSIVSKCPNCKEVADPPSAPSTSNQLGRLWEDVDLKENVQNNRESVHNTRSRSSVTVAKMETKQLVEQEPPLLEPVLPPPESGKIRIIFRRFCKYLIKLKILDDLTELQLIDAQTQHLSSPDDMAQAIEKILMCVKKVLTTSKEKGTNDKAAISLKAEIEKLKEDHANEVDKLKQKTVDKLKQQHASEIEKLKQEHESLKTRMEAEINEKENIIEDINSKLESSQIALEVNMKCLQDQLEEKIHELQLTLQASEKLKKEYLKCRTLLSIFYKQQKIEKNKQCESCKTAKYKILALEKDIETQKLHRSNVEKKFKDLESNYEVLNKEKKVLSDKLLHRRAFLDGDEAARAALNKQYDQLLMAEKRRKEEEKANSVLESQPLINIHTYIGQDSWKANPNKSLKGSFDPVKSVCIQNLEEEESFLNHTYLNESHLEPDPFSEDHKQRMKESFRFPTEDRSQELNRRNTLLPRHLQSRYALEQGVQVMTPGQRKFSLAPSGEESGLLGHGAIKKRKVSEMESYQASPSKRQSGVYSRPSSVSRTPKPLMTFRGGRPFVTPSSVKRLKQMWGKRSKQN